MLPNPSHTIVLGGARSGKSRHAESLITAHPGPWLYLATAQAFDAEMENRIATHRATRAPGWITRECPLDLVGALTEAPEGQPLLIDCLTLWLTNMMLNDRDVPAECTRLTTRLAAPRGPWVVVSNETSLGIVPDNPLARHFRDASGTLNQAVAAVAQSVQFLVAGLPITAK